ncbi:hypothetical protein [Carboxylicivirga sp. RSCT41]|uniref:hypothetical protein n=1 Tax=Carboxylicivirga agarovorans TaxID=3417570 RepID=UPI003D33F5A6
MNDKEIITIFQRNLDDFKSDIKEDIRELKDDVKELRKESLNQCDNCKNASDLKVLSNKVEVIDNELSEYRMIKKYPKIVIGAFIVFALVSILQIYSYIGTIKRNYNYNQKMNQTEYVESVENIGYKSIIRE